MRTVDNRFLKIKKGEKRGKNVMSTAVLQSINKIGKKKFEFFKGFELYDLKQTDVNDLDELFKLGAEIKREYNITQEDVLKVCKEIRKDICKCI